MKLLFLPAFISLCIALTGAADFKHFPVQTGRGDSARTVQAPARPPGKRERVREEVQKSEIVLQDPSSDYSDEDEDVPRARVTATTERVRVNRNRVRSRTRIASSERKVETTTKPARQRIRIRTKPPRLETTATTLRPSLIEQSTKSAPVRQLGDEKESARAVLKNEEKTMPVVPFIQTKSVPNIAPQISRLSPNIEAAAAKPSIPQQEQGVIQLSRTEELQPGRFVQLQQQSLAQQSQPTPLRVFTQNTFKQQPRIPEPIPFPQSSPTQPQQQLQPRPFQQQSFQPNQFQPQQQPLQQQQFQPQPLQRQPLQPQQIQTKQFQSQPLKEQSIREQPRQIANIASVPTFQERPSLFSSPIEIPQQDGTGASFSYEAFVG